MIVEEKWQTRSQPNQSSIVTIEVKGQTRPHSGTGIYDNASIGDETSASKLLSS